MLTDNALFNEINGLNRFAMKLCKNVDAEYIQRLDTGGDCCGGVRIDLTKPWQDLVRNLLEQDVLKI